MSKWGKYGVANVSASVSSRREKKEMVFFFFF